MTHNAAARHLDQVEKEFLKNWVRRNPMLGTSLGLHDESDASMPDGSLDKELDDQRFLNRTLHEFEKIPEADLPPSRAVDRDLAIHILKNWIFDREVLKYWESQPEAPQLVGHAIFQILSRNYAPLAERIRSIMKRLEKLPKYLDQSRSKLTAPAKPYVEIELETITRLPGFFNMIKDVSRENLTISAERDLHRLIDQAQNALERYSDWLIVDVLPDCRDDRPLGEETFRKLLHVRGIDASPTTLAARAETEMGRLRERQKEIARTIRRKVSLEDVRDGIRQQHPENFDGVLRFSRECVAKTRQFVTRSHFVTLPEGDQLYVVETPIYLRHLLPEGTYAPPTKHGVKREGYFYVTPGDCDSDKLREHNYAALSNLAVREGYPGRHVQMSWATLHPSTLRILHEDPAIIQGWSAYCEERVKEMGYDDVPTARFMQSQSMTLAALRVAIDVRLASGKMTANQAVETIIDHLGMDRVSAEAEVRRYVFSPGAQVAPVWGREQIKELKKWTRGQMGERFSETFFHTAILQAGLLPFHLLKRDLKIRIDQEKAKTEAPETAEKQPPPATAKKKPPAARHKKK